MGEYRCYNSIPSIVAQTKKIDALVYELYGLSEEEIKEVLSSKKKLTLSITRPTTCVNITGTNNKNQ